VRIEKEFDGIDGAKVVNRRDKAFNLPLTLTFLELRQFETTFGEAK
jgi:hypothetical protein